MTHESNLVYTKERPFLAFIKERYSLCKPYSKKNTQHIVIDIEGSGIKYNVGDCLGVFPTNGLALVDQTLKVLHATGEEIVCDPRSNGHYTLREFLTKKGNITQFSRKLLDLIFTKQTTPSKKQFLSELLADTHKERLKNYMHNHELWDLLSEHAEIHWAPQEICDLMMPLLPRLYSIASAQEWVGNEVHLTVSNLAYLSNHHLRRGVCTHYLSDTVPIEDRSVPIYPHPHHGFTLPDDPRASLIMIGPGTGVAPYRGFLQARMRLGHTGRNWLFFGEWNRSTDFFYEDEWVQMQKQLHLQIDTAFSRDQAEKIYVQHRMLEKSEEFYRWLEEGAYLYVCGDASHMAKDVDTVLHQIIQVQGKKSPEEAKAYVKSLRSEKRYLRDVY